MITTVEHNAKQLRTCYQLVTTHKTPHSTSIVHHALPQTTCIRCAFDELIYGDITNRIGFGVGRTKYTHTTCLSLFGASAPSSMCLRKLALAIR